MSKKILEIVQAISQAVHNKHHGSGDEIGLRREDPESCVIMDGFGVKFAGNRLVVTYNSEEAFHNAHNPKFESVIEETVDDVVKYIKSEYKKHGKGTLSLKEIGEINVMVETANRRTVKVTATKTFEIGGLGDEVLSPQNPESEKSKEVEKLEKTLKEFRALSPSNRLYGK
jgi:hypothetical protein